MRMVMAATLFNLNWTLSALNMTPWYKNIVTCKVDLISANLS